MAAPRLRTAKFPPILVYRTRFLGLLEPKNHFFKIPIYFILSFEKGNKTQIVSPITIFIFVWFGWLRGFPENFGDLSPKGL